MTGVLRDRRSGRILTRRPTKSSVVVGLTLGTLAFLTVAGMFFLDGKGVDVWEAIGKTFRDLGKMFFEPQLKRLEFGEAVWQILVTLGLAFLTTLIGAVIALVLSLFAAQNLANKYVSNIIKGFIAVVRAIPTVLWVLIFAIGAGLGSVAAIIGMTFHTVGYLLKAYSEAFEEIDSGVIEALKASGASWLQIVFQAILPSSVTYLLSWTFIRFEINFTTAVAMGAAAGAGGIGFDLFMAASFYFDLREVGAITWIILIVSLVLEVIATQLRERNRLHV